MCAFLEWKPDLGRHCGLRQIPLYMPPRCRYQPQPDGSPSAILVSFGPPPQHLVNMLSHLNNDHHNNRVRRSKSATSVKERRKHPIAIEPVDAESARMQALIAAHRAMDRSRGSPEADLYRSDSSASKQSARLARGRYATKQSDPAAQLQRQRSLLQATSPNLAVTLPLPGAGSAARSGPHSTAYTTELPEFGGSFEGEPSSYRRLRKTHSVLNPSHG